MTTKDVNIFEQAARNKTRISTVVGQITVEQLWALPLTDDSRGLDLDTTAQRLHEEIEKLGKKSFVKSTPNAKRSDLDLQFALVKHVIDVKMAEDAARAEAATKKRELDQLTVLLGKRQEKDLENLSTEEIQKRIAQIKAA